MKKSIHLLFFVIFLSTLIGCSARSSNDSLLSHVIHVDGKKYDVHLVLNSTVQEVLTEADISLGELDRVSPPTYTMLTGSTEITITRVTEEFSVKDVPIPFESQIIQNESLAEGENILIQPGVNGLEQITYRKLIEDGVQISTSIFSRSTIVEPTPEITMVGISKPFTAVSIPGKLAFIVAGNAWLMEGTTEDRRPVVSTGDLDGYIFSISFDGKWLLFTRKNATGQNAINSLWVINLDDVDAMPIDLDVSNIINHAAWVPGAANTLTYSTVEPRATAPGWQSNNDLFILSFSDGGSIWRNENIIEINGGGEYGWWGTSYFWAPNGSVLMYSRPDGIGYVDFTERMLVPQIRMMPFNTHSEWAWVAQVGWSPSSSSFFYSAHQASQDVSNQETSPLFSIVGVNESDLSSFIVYVGVGMFANPIPATITEYGHFQIAYYSAIFPDQSDSSRYRLGLMDRDGSNQHLIFPPEGSAGMEPKKILWAPDRLLEQPYFMAVIYGGNLWLIESETGNAKQITGDGLISSIDWK